MKIHPTTIIERNVKIRNNICIGPFSFIGEGTFIGENCKIFGYCHLYDCKIGVNTKIGPFTEIQKRVVIGRNCKIQSHSFICEGVKIKKGVFVGHNVIFINDKNPQAANQNGKLLGREEWQLLETIIENNVSLGSGSIISPVKIGEYALVGAGAIVTKNVPKHAVVYGIPAKIEGIRCFCSNIIKSTDLLKNKNFIRCKECGKKIKLDFKSYGK